MIKVGLIGVACCGVIAALFFGFPLKKDPQAIREELLREKPIGTSMSEVERWLAKEKKLEFKKVKTGFLKQDVVPVVVVGAKSINAKLGEYRSPLLTTVVAYWGFSDRGDLIDVWVWKTTDGP
jgi:hypothetical protein